MEQDYSYELALELLRGPRHVRSLAAALRTNHMTVSRKLGRLMDWNVADYASEGRNKRYFLKGSEEARSFVLMAEHYRLMRFLDAHGTLRGIIREIQNNGRIPLALIFGSYAKGKERSGSDIDIYAESTDREIKRNLESIDGRLSVQLGAYDPGNPLIREMEKDHVIIKGAERFHEFISASRQAEGGGETRPWRPRRESIRRLPPEVREPLRRSRASQSKRLS